MGKGIRAYEVGYGKPPQEHQWPSGTSGNLNGRPRKPKEEKECPTMPASTLGQLILKDANKPLKLRSGEGETEMTSNHPRSPPNDYCRRRFHQAGTSSFSCSK